MSLSLRGGAETATLPQAISIAWQDGQQIVADPRRRSPRCSRPPPSSACASTCWFRSRPATSRRGFAWCVRALHQAARWNMVEVFTVGVLLSLVRLAGLADASPGPGLFALGALTVLFAAIESAGPEAPVVARAMSAAGRRRRRRLPRLRELRPGLGRRHRRRPARWSSTARAAATSCTRPSRSRCSAPGPASSPPRCSTSRPTCCR